MPDALLRGSLEDRGEAARTGSDLPPLPDRWVVLRLIAPNDAVVPAVSGWVLESDTARVVPLADWDGTASAGVSQFGRTVEPADLNGTAGGSVAWTAGYDATAGRFAVHDPLDDLPAQRNGVR